VPAEWSAKGPEIGKKEYLSSGFRRPSPDTGSFSTSLTAAKSLKILNSGDGHASASALIAVTTIPSAPPAVRAASKPSQLPAAASAPADDSHSFASFLKSSQNQQSEEQPEQGSTLPKPSMVGKDKGEKDAKKNGDSKKSPLTAEMASVPVPVAAMPSPEAKPLLLSWPAAKEIKAGSGNPSQSADTQAQAADDAEAASADVTQALKASSTETLAKAPVAFTVTLSKAEGAKAHGSQPKSAAPTGEGAPSAKTVGEAIKPDASKSSSGGQQHSNSSHQDQALPQNSKDVKATATPPKVQAESFSPVHSAPPAGQTSTVAATVQNAYAPTQPATIEKAAPAPPVASVMEPVQTPLVRSQNIDLKIAGADNSQVDVRVSQRAGDVQVTVRTPDGELAQSLRQHLPELSDRLSQTGASGELWQPPQAQSASAGGNDVDSRYSDHAQTQQQQHQNQQQHSQGSSHQGSRQQERETPESVWLNELNKAEKGKY
jgi:hypothetical protein